MFCNTPSCTSNAHCPHIFNSQAKLTQCLEVCESVCHTVQQAVVVAVHVGCCDVRQPQVAQGGRQLLRLQAHANGYTAGKDRVWIASGKRVRSYTAVSRPQTARASCRLFTHKQLQANLRCHYSHRLCPSLWLAYMFEPHCAAEE